jgi:hypothetical protein
MILSPLKCSVHPFRIYCTSASPSDTSPQPRMTEEKIINKGFKAHDRETVVSHIKKCHARHNALNRFNTRIDVSTEWSFSWKVIHSIQRNCLYVSAETYVTSLMYTQPYRPLILPFLLAHNARERNTDFYRYGNRNVTS